MNLNIPPIPFPIVVLLSVISLLWIYGFAATNFQNTSNKSIDIAFGLYLIFLFAYMISQSVLFAQNMYLIMIPSMNLVKIITQTAIWSPGLFSLACIFMATLYSIKNFKKSAIAFSSVGAAYLLIFFTNFYQLVWITS